MWHRIRGRLQGGWLYVTAVSTAVLALCSRSSPFYPLNNWPDAQCLFMIGKAMFGGRVLYRDVFDQKGPLVFFAHGLAGLVQSDGFFGVFLLEVAAGAVFLWYCHKIFALYGFERLGWAALPLILAAGFSTLAFQMGDSVEQLCMPFFAASLYAGLAALRSPQCMGRRAALVQGVLAGCVCWSKFNLCAFYAALGLVLFLDCLARGGAKKALALTGGFFAGFALAALPWLLYFAANGALGDLWQGYFYNNLFLYSSSRSAGEILGAAFAGVTGQLRRNWTMGVFVLLGGLWALFWPGRCWQERLLPLLGLGLQAVAVYGLSTYSFAYYAMALMVFVPLGFLPLLWLAEKLLAAPGLRALARPCLLAGAACVLGVGFAFWRTPNRVAFAQPRQQTPQYYLTDIIRQAEDQTMITWNHQDNGFYTAMDRVPEYKFIGGYNLELPQIVAMRAFPPDPEKYAFVISSCEEDRLNIFRAETEPRLLNEGYAMVAGIREQYLTGAGYINRNIYLYQRVEDAAR